MNYNFIEENQLKELCQKANLTYIAYERLMYKYVKHLTIKEIAKIYSVEELSIKQSIRRSRKIINKVISKKR